MQCIYLYYASEAECTHPSLIHQQLCYITFFLFLGSLTSILAAAGFCTLISGGHHSTLSKHAQNGSMEGCTFYQAPRLLPLLL